MKLEEVVSTTLLSPLLKFPKIFQQFRQQIIRRTRFPLASANVVTLTSRGCQKSLTASLYRLVLISVFCRYSRISSVDRRRREKRQTMPNTYPGWSSVSYSGALYFTKMFRTDPVRVRSA